MEEELRSKMQTGPNGRCALSLSIDSEVPMAMMDLQELEELSICHSQITSIPEEIKHLTNLKVIDLKDNEFTEFPRHLCALHNLEEIDLSHNDISQLPDELCQLKKLRRLTIMDNNLEGALDKQLCNLTSLETLNISRNKLSSFSACMCQLSNLKYLDLSRNNFTIPPRVIETLTQLEKLDISYNKLEEFFIDLSGLHQLENLDVEGNLLTAIPSAVCGLRRIKRLDISKNSISSLPPCFSTSLAGTLQELWMEHNQFVGFPEEVCGLTNLTTLSLNGNPLHAIPDSICQLSNLKNLDIGSCSLSELPESVCVLEKLQWLCLNENRIKKLPRAITQLKELSFIYLHKNPLRYPPLAVCMRGVKAIFNFINEATNEPTIHQKLILIGNVKAGKTSLARTLMQGLSQLTSEEDRTIVLDQTSWTLKRNLHLEVYDFGGNAWYDVVRHFFIDKHAIVLLVVNLVRYSDRAYDECVGRWLQFLQARAPGAKLYIVGTHTDRCTTEEIGSKRSSIFEIMKSKEKQEDKQVRQELETLQRSDLHTDLLEKRLKESLKNHLALPQKVFSVSSKSLENIDELRTELSREAKTRGRIIPASWQQLFDQIHFSSLSKGKRFLTLEDILAIDRSIHKGRDTSNTKSRTVRRFSERDDQGNLTSSSSDKSDFEESTKTGTKPQSHKKSNAATKSVERATGLHTVDEMNDKGTTERRHIDSSNPSDEGVSTEKRVVTRKLSSSKMLSAKERLGEILAFFHSIGDVMWYEENPDIKNFVFHKQAFLIKLLKSIFTEKLNEELESEPSRAFMKQGFSSHSLQFAKHELERRGIMSLQLLKGILDHLQLEDKMVEAVVQLLIQFDLCFPVPIKPSDPVLSKVQFPWFLKMSEPEEAADMLLHPPGGDCKRFILEYIYPVSCPPTLYENMSVRMHRIFRDVEGIRHWKNGVYARMRACKVLLHRSQAPTASTISLQVQGSDVAELWRLLTRLQEEFLTIMDSWPGVVREAWLICPHCTKAGDVRPFRFPGEFLETECPDDEDYMLCPNTEELIPIYMLHPVTASRDTPSTDELQEVAAEVCRNWQMLGRSLGLEESVLAQVECAHKPSDLPHEKVYQMLLRWTQIRGSKATRASLAYALSSKFVDRQDLAEKVSGRIKRHGKGT